MPEQIPHDLSVHQIDDNDWTIRDAAGKALAIVWRGQTDQRTYRGALLTTSSRVEISHPDFGTVVEYLCNRIPPRSSSDL